MIETFVMFEINLLIQIRVIIKKDLQRILTVTLGINLQQNPEASF